MQSPTPDRLSPREVAPPTLTRGLSLVRFGMLGAIVVLVACADNVPTSAPMRASTPDAAIILPNSGTYTTRGNMPAARFGQAAAKVDGKWYVIGGGDVNAVAQATVHRYDPATDEWTSRASLPAPEIYRSAGAVGTSVYLVDANNTLHRYNTVTDSWSERASPTIMRFGAAMVGHKGLLYAFGGQFGEMSAEVYNPATNSWSAIASMPNSLWPNLGTAVTIGNRILVIGLVNPIVQWGALYDPATDAWTPIAPFALEWGWAPQVAVVGDVAYVIETASTRAYDPATNSWTQLATMTSPALGGATASFGDRILVAGGYYSGALSRVLEFKPASTGNHAPVASFTVSEDTTDEGTSIAFDASASGDPDGDAITYAWNFGDGATSTSATPSHPYADNGSYVATLTVSDGSRATVAKKKIRIRNVAPSVGPIGPDTIIVGEYWTRGVGFTDPGADSWIAHVQHAGFSDQGASITGQTVGVAWNPGSIGSFSPRIVVTDDDGGVGVARAQLRVIGLPAAAVRLRQMFLEAYLEDGLMAPGDTAGPLNTLERVRKRLVAGDHGNANNWLASFGAELDVLAISGKLTPESETRLRNYAARIRDQLQLD